MSPLFARYQRIATWLPKQLRWLALIFAPAATSASVLIAGLITVTAGVTITVGINQISPRGAFSWSVMWILIIAFLFESLGFLVKERQELLLVVAVRQLTYRRFRRLFNTSAPSANAREHTLTYPGQISQFAYIVDATVSIVQIVVFLAASITMYGLAGALSALLIAGIAAVSIRLISLIGRVWEQYIELEGKRRHWIQRVANVSPRGKFIPSWGAANGRIAAIRQAEEGLLRKRVVLQVLNGFIDRGALTVILVLVATIAAFLWPATGFSIGIILAARYLYGAVKNSLANYRVIRLAIPMMRELDSLENNKVVLNGSITEADYPINRIEVLSSESDRAKALRVVAPVPGVAFIPLNPEITRPVLEVWRTHATDQELSRFNDFSTWMGLSSDVTRRFWLDSSTLSSGERHRAVLALVMAEDPKWLILDDTFAALDPSMRDEVGKVVVASGTKCTLIATSEEYVPASFADDAERDLIFEAPRSEDPQIDSQDPYSAQSLPDPEPKYATFRRSISLLFGLNVIWLTVGAVLLAGSEVTFAIIISNVNHISPQTAFSLTMCGLVTLVGTVLFFSTVYHVPISRLGKLHSRILRRIDEFASPQTSGGVVGRLGEDFSDLQMSIPGALGSVFIVLTQTILLIAGAVAGAPIFIIVVVAIIPLSYLAMRQGGKYILPAATAAANRRGEFLGAVGAQAGLHMVPVSTSLKDAGDIAYEECERLYLASSVGQANAYLFRSTLIQCLTLVLNISAVVLAAAFGSANQLIAPAAIVFFAITLSSGVESTVETLQEVGVLGLTTERVRLLEDYRIDHTLPSIHSKGLNQVVDLIESGHVSVALIGKTGAGKSVILETLCRQRPEGQTVIVPDVDPFAGKKTVGSGLALYRTEVNTGKASLILLDETFKGLTPDKEREELKHLVGVLTQKNKRSVVVLHSRSNLDCFSNVVDLDN